MTDNPSRSFGSVTKWHCETEADLLLLFNKNSPLPNQASWTVFQPTKEVCMKLLSVLQMEDTTMEEWTRQGKTGKHIGDIGTPSSHLWEWNLSYRIPHSGTRSNACQDLEASRKLDTLVRENKSKLARSLALSQSLGR